MLTVEQLQAMAVSWHELLQDARLHRGILDTPIMECKKLLTDSLCRFVPSTAVYNMSCP